MRNLFKLAQIVAFIAIIAFSMTTCAEEETDIVDVRRSTCSIMIEDFPEQYKGYTVIAYADPYVAASRFEGTGVITTGKISNQGAVTLNVWEETQVGANADGITDTVFIGAGAITTSVAFDFFIFKEETLQLTKDELDDIGNYLSTNAFESGILSSVTIDFTAQPPYKGSIVTP